MANHKNIIPMGILQVMTLDIDGMSALVDFKVIAIVDDNNPYAVLLGIECTIDMNGVINLKKQTMSFERKSLLQKDCAILNWFVIMKVTMI